jgi:hypothetical protein
MRQPDRTRSHSRRPPVGVLAASFAAIIFLSGCIPLPPLTPTVTPTATFTRTPEPLVPTPLPTATPTATATLTLTPTQTPVAATAPVSATLTITATATLTDTIAVTPTAAPPARPTTTASPTPETTTDDDAAPQGSAPEDAWRRIGVGLAVGDITDYDWGDGLPGWYLAWQVQKEPELPGDIRFVQMVYLFEDAFRPPIPDIQAAARANPGSLWLIGNEPDVAWQGNTTPEQYAATYGLLYPAIKEADPTAQVAIGGVSQPTPLRIEYLERILAAYEAQFGAPMPIDVWNVHAFILREERDSWGVGIPPGMEVEQGKLYEIADHDDMAIFRQQIEHFRRWMAEQGFRDKPLVVSEYGILMPDSYGFPPDAVSQFMVDTFDYFLTARDPETGYPDDDDRLVQAFCWFSVGDTVYPTSNLFDPAPPHAVTPVGKVFRAYVTGLR